MKRLVGIIIVFLCFGTVLGQDISIEMYVSPDTVEVGQQAMLAVVVKSGEQDLPQPQMPNLSMFEAYSSGTSTNISIVNGAVESSNAYNYLIIPKQQGTFNIKPAVLVHNRKRYESNEVVLTVVDRGGVSTPKGTQDASRDRTSGETRDVFMTAHLDKDQAFVNQQVTLTVKFYHAVRLRSNPDYTAPQTSDFWSENLDPQRTYAETINGRRYNVIELNTALFPTRPGDLEVGSAMVTVSVPDRRAHRQRDPFGMFDSFFDRGVPRTIRTDPLKIKVIPLPDRGKPNDFSGTVGNFNITSSVDKTTVDVNQPINVTYKISGTGNIKTVAEPSVEETADFRVYRASSDERVSKLQGVVGGTKVFEETFIPKRAGKLTIPAVELSFFDPRSRKYKSVRTRPITITAKQASLSDYADLPVPNVAGRVIDSDSKDIRYIKTDSGNLRKEQPLILMTPLYLILNGVPVLLLAFVYAVRKRREKFSSDIGYARSRTAKKMARKRLARARKLAEGDKADKFYAEIRMAMFSYVADKLNISPHGMTGDDLIEIVQKSGITEESLKEIKGLLRKADFAQYAPAEVTREEITGSLKKAEEILVHLEGLNIA